MLLTELYDQLAPALPSYARKDVQTAVRVLAKALHCSDPQHCFPEHYHQPLPTLSRLVEDYLLAQGKGAHTIRNTKNYLSRLFRLAEEHHFLSRVPLAMTPRYTFKNRTHRSGSSVSQNNGTYLPYAQWPPDLQDAFTAFQTWATAPVTPGRPAQLRKRLTTLEGYRNNFESYFGYLHHRVQLSPTFDALFDLLLVTAYVHWHVNECHQRVTYTIHEFLRNVLALTRQYRPDEQLRAKLLALKKTLPPPSPVYDKTDAWVSLATLGEIGRSLWPRKLPHEVSRHDKSVQHPGLHFAVYAGISLMLQLWTYIPYRQRNMREMRLGDNLHKDDQGCWWITFRGEQLKVATKRRRINVFNLRFPDKLVPVLENYLTLWRPILLAKAGHLDTHVFLTKNGIPFTRLALSQTTSTIIYRYTGKHWHPHIVRTVWTTEWIRNGGDFLTAAMMLNDDLKTVVANYSHLRNENVAEEVYATLDRRNGHGK
jgi:hypothetical protein